MPEPIRTIVHFAVAAVALLLVGIELGRPFSGPKVIDDPSGFIKSGDPFFKDFDNPAKANSLELVKFDEKVGGEATSFRVAKVKGQWVIPSKSNYPADAQDRLRDVATTLIDLKPIDFASTVAEDHVLYGVVEPKVGATKTGDQGVGQLVTVQDEEKNDLFKLIIGKEVAGEGDTPSGQRFVRKPGSDIVWVAKFDMSKLPTDFDQWIEKDLLKLNALDVAKVSINDYNVLPLESGSFGKFPRMDAVVSWNTEKGEWRLDQLVRYKQVGQTLQYQPVADGLGDQEELNKTKLDDLKTALDDLKIVNVERKPPGINAELIITDELRRNREGISSLKELGFYPVSQRGDRLELASANGEVIIDMKDGVQYVLRFGNVEDDISAAGAKQNRYLFVSAQLSPDVTMPPKLQAEPAGPEAPMPPAGEAGEKKSGGGGADEQAVEQVAQAAAQPPAVPGEPVKPGPPPMIDPVKAAADKIRKENRRKMEDWEDKKKKATTRVAALNARFADWYYIISEDVYKKVHLSRADIIKEASGAKDEGFGIDAFRKLESDGIKQTIPSAPPGGGPRPGGFDPSTFRGGFDQ